MKEKEKKKFKKNFIKSSVIILLLFIVICLTSIKTFAFGYGDYFLSNYYEPTVNIMNSDGEYHNVDIFMNSIPNTSDFSLDSFVSSDILLEINSEFTGNATTTNIFQVTPNYRINNIGSFAGLEEMILFQLDYEFITLFDEFIINYYLGEPTDLIPCSLYFANSLIENVTITYNWTYSKQENGSIVDYNKVFIENNPDLEKPINMLPMNEVSSISELNEFMNLYGNGQFIKIKKCQVIISFEPIYTDEFYFNALQYSTILGNYDNNNLLAWYDFDNMSSIGDIGSGLLDAANGIVQFEILPNFTLLDAILIILAIPLLIWILKVAFGG